MLANTEGDDREVDDEDEEQRLIQSEMDGDPHMRHSVNDLSSKAGIILVRPSGSFAVAWLIRLFLEKGLHNICIVIPQFLVTGMASIIFALFDPDKSAIHRGKAQDIPVPVPPANGTIPGAVADMRFARAEGVSDGASGGSIGLLFK